MLSFITLKKKKSRSFRINGLGGNCSHVIDSLDAYTYPCLRVGLSYVFRAQIGALPFQFGNCQRAIYIRCIAASQLETRFPSFTELVVVGRKGKRKRIWGQRETKVTKAGSKGRIYQNIDFFRNLFGLAAPGFL